MADAENAGGSAGVGRNFGIVKSPPGLNMLINIILLFVSWITISIYMGSYHTSATSFFMTCTLIPFIIFCVLLVLFVFNVHSKIPINWPITMLINCGLWAVLLAIASVMVLIQAIRYEVFTPGLASGFGFLSVAGLTVQAIFHYKESRS